MKTELRSKNHLPYAFTQLFDGNHHDSHTILGLHATSNTDPKLGKVIRLWRPGAESLHLEYKGNIVLAEKVHPQGVFEYLVPNETTFRDYRIYHQDGSLTYDPYAFFPTFGEVDQYLYAKGVHYDLDDVLGARLGINQGVAGVKFTVWAPSAKRVSLVSDFNYWDGRVNPMRSLGQSGIWEIFIPGLKAGTKYKFEIKSQSEDVKLKSDPLAYSSELRPLTASIVADLTSFSWTDQEWLKRRVEKKNQPQPLNIYEVHLGSWRKEEWRFKNYRDLAVELAAYCKEMGFTHVELLPVAEHPLDESWGYQVSGFYAVTSRHGTPTDFQFFINHLHENDIGVILDWVPGHFPTDDFSLGRFDGTALYEHEDPRQGFHPHWSTNIFNFGRHEVSNFLIANALFWFKKMHIDGLRVDAVASMLYLDYGREEGEWIANCYGGKENLEAIEFFKHLNAVVHEKHPGVYMIAEESTSFAGISHSLDSGGLGFDMKWNMGWMNDTLRYFSKDSLYRHHHHGDLTFGLLYAFTERFVLVLSHDEVVHGKNSLIAKMPGDLWQKFANLRLLLAYMMCQPGKKLLFMGGEFGQWSEWQSGISLDWHLLDYETHKGVQTMVKELNHFYLSHSPLWERDFNYQGFEWVDFADSKNSVISYLRKGSQGLLLCVHNFTPEYHADYYLKLPQVISMKEVFNTDAKKYGGSGKINGHIHVVHNDLNNPCGVKLSIAPLATMIFEVERYEH